MSFKLITLKCVSCKFVNIPLTTSSFEYKFNFILCLFHSRRPGKGAACKNLHKKKIKQKEREREKKSQEVGTAGFDLTLLSIRLHIKQFLNLQWMLLLVETKHGHKQMQLPTFTTKLCWQYSTEHCWYRYGKYRGGVATPIFGHKHWITHSTLKIGV